MLSFFEEIQAMIAERDAAHARGEEWIPKEEEPEYVPYMNDDGTVIMMDVQEFILDLPMPNLDKRDQAFAEIYTQVAEIRDRSIRIYEFDLRDFQTIYAGMLDIEEMAEVVEMVKESSPPLQEESKVVIDLDLPKVYPAPNLKVEVMNDAEKKALHDHVLVAALEQSVDSVKLGPAHMQLSEEGTQRFNQANPGLFQQSVICHNNRGVVLEVKATVDTPRILALGTDKKSANRTIRCYLDDILQREVPIKLDKQLCERCGFYVFDPHLFCRKPKNYHKWYEHLVVIGEASYRFDLAMFFTYLIRKKGVKNAKAFSSNYEKYLTNRFRADFFKKYFETSNRSDGSNAAHFSVLYATNVKFKKVLMLIAAEFLFAVD